MNVDFIEFRQYFRCVLPQMILIQLYQTSCSTSRGWCDSVKIDGELFGTDKEKQIDKGGNLVLHDARKNREEILTKEKLMRDIQMYAEKPVYGDVFEVVDQPLIY